MSLKKILIIQTAFIGDVVLATSLIKQTKELFTDSTIDFLLRKGNQSLLKENPNIRNIICWDKKKGKYKNLLLLAINARKEQYDIVLNIQRFTSSGIFLLICGAKNKVGFDKNPLSYFFHHRIKHQIPHIDPSGEILHEVQRNSLLLSPFRKQNEKPQLIRPEIFFSQEENRKVSTIQERALDKEYLVIAPSSVWFTKQWHKDKWIELCQKLDYKYHIFLIGGPDDSKYVESISNHIENKTNLCGELTLTESALLMRRAKRVFVNDSAPLHLASSVNAPTTAIFCSTVKSFGYFPLSEESKLFQVNEDLACRPCGLHGKKQCPLGHFKCSMLIDVNDVISGL